MPSQQESVAGIGSWVPQLFYDIIARLVPGTVIIGTLAVAIAGPEESKRFLDVWMNKSASLYPSLVIVIATGFVLSYALAIIFLGLSEPIEKLAFQLAGVDECDFVLKYDYIKQHDPPAGSRITKLKAEMHMTELLILGFSIALVIDLTKNQSSSGGSRGVLALVLVIAILGSIGALKHFIVRQNHAVENCSKLLGFEEWKTKNAQKTLPQDQSSAKKGKMEIANKIIYGLFGAGAIVYGVVNLLIPTFMVPESAGSFVLSHILREQAAAAIFIGLMFFWCIFNYERRTTVHYFLIVATFLLAAIHWSDYLTGHLNWMSPLYNTVPFLVLALMAFASRLELRQSR